MNIIKTHFKQNTPKQNTFQQSNYSNQFTAPQPPPKDSFSSFATFSKDNPLHVISRQPPKTTTDHLITGGTYRH